MTGAYSTRCFAGGCPAITRYGLWNGPVGFAAEIPPSGDAPCPAKFTQLLSHLLLRQADVSTKRAEITGTHIAPGGALATYQMYQLRCTSIVRERGLAHTLPPGAGTIYRAQRMYRGVQLRCSFRRSPTAAQRGLQTGLFAGPPLDYAG